VAGCPPVATTMENDHCYCRSLYDRANLRDYQVTAAESTRYNAADRPTAAGRRKPYGANAILNFPTGSGKCRCVAVVLADWEHCLRPCVTDKSLVIAPTLPIAEDWCKCLASLLEHGVALISRKKEAGNSCTARVLVTTVSTLTVAGDATRAKITRWIPFNNVNVWDEVHGHAAPLSRQVMSAVDPHRDGRWIGLTGTAFRRIDGEFQYTIENFGGRVTSIPYARLRAAGYLSNIVWVGVCVSAAGMVHAFPLLLRVLRSRKVLIFFDRVDECERYAKQFGLAFVHGQVHEKEIETVIRALRLGIITCVATTSIMEAGVNLPDVDVIVEMFSYGQRAAGGFFQRIGRGARVSERRNTLVFTLYPPHKEQYVLHRVREATLAGIVSTEAVAEKISTTTQPRHRQGQGLTLPIPGVVTVRAYSTTMTVDDFCGLHDTLDAGSTVLLPCGENIRVASRDYAHKQAAASIATRARGAGVLSTTFDAQLATALRHGDFDAFQTRLDRPYFRQKVRATWPSADVDACLRFERAVFDLGRLEPTNPVTATTAMLGAAACKDAVKVRCDLVGAPVWMRRALALFAKSYTFAPAKSTKPKKRLVAQLNSNDHLRGLAVHEAIVRGCVVRVVEASTASVAVEAVMPAEHADILLKMMVEPPLLDEDTPKKKRKVLRRLRRMGFVKTSGTTWEIVDNAAVLQAVRQLFVKFAAGFAGDDWQCVQCQKVVEWLMAH